MEEAAPDSEAMSALAMSAAYADAVDRLAKDHGVSAEDWIWRLLREHDHAESLFKVDLAFYQRGKAALERYRLVLSGPSDDGLAPAPGAIAAAEVPVGNLGPPTVWQTASLLPPWKAWS